MAVVLPHDALYLALLAAAALTISHVACVSLVMYHDLTGRWAQYSLCKSRDVGLADYVNGYQSFASDMLLLFLPFMTFCFWFNFDAVKNCKDSLVVSVVKLAAGYLLGKVWAFAVHYCLHHPALYQFHRKHHAKPQKLVASASWLDSYVEYAVMELPSFGICVLLMPTHIYVHMIHFCWHGWDGAKGHSAFSPPGILGYFFDGKYHYQHHAHLTVDYAELEIIDLFFGTHHSQIGKGKKL